MRPDLNDLAAAARRQHRAKQDVDRLILDAVENRRASHADIGAAMGITKQSVTERLQVLRRRGAER